MQVSDIAIAVREGADAIMLSGETGTSEVYVHCVCECFCVSCCWVGIAVSIGGGLSKCH